MIKCIAFKNFYQKIRLFSLRNILYLFFLIEIINNLTNFYGYSFLRVSLFFKFFLTICFFLELKKIRYITALAILTLIYMFSFFIFHGNDLNIVLLVENFIIFSKYLFFPVTFLFFIKFLNDKELIIIYKKQFETIFIINNIFIIVGALFSITFFKTYMGNRFGYNGVFLSQNVSSYIMLISCFHFIGTSLYFKENRITYLKLLLSLVAISLMGTKTVYFSLLLFFIFTLFLIRRKIILIFLFFLILITIIGFKSSFFSVFYDIYIEKDFWYSLTSVRSEYVESRFLFNLSNHWSFGNYLIGGSFLQSYKLVEMSFLDLFLFFGVIGVGIYLYLVYCVMKDLIKNTYNLIVIAILFFASFFSGHFFQSGSVSLYLAIFLLINYSNDSKSYQRI